MKYIEKFLKLHKILNPKKFEKYKNLFMNKVKNWNIKIIHLKKFRDNLSAQNNLEIFLEEKLTIFKSEYQD